jgi:hypothetical protein
MSASGSAQFLNKISLTSSDRTTHKCVLVGKVEVTKPHNIVDRVFKPRQC